MASSSSKYGLFIPKKTNKGAVLKPTITSVFGDDSDEESGASAVNQMVNRESARAKVKKQTQLEIDKALQEDPSVYEYDTIYDNIQAQKVTTDVKEAHKVDRKPKYIAGLLKMAEVRKREEERRIERKVQKEREEEGDLYADKEAFVTSAYKKKMQEQQEEAERERRQAAMEEMLDVTKQKDLSGFYRYLYRETTGTVPAESEDTEKTEDGVKVKEEPNSDTENDRSSSGRMKVKVKEEPHSDTEKDNSSSGREKKHHHREKDSRHTSHRHKGHRDYKEEPHSRSPEHKSRSEGSSRQRSRSRERPRSKDRGRRHYRSRSRSPTNRRSGKQRSRSRDRKRDRSASRDRAARRRSRSEERSRPRGKGEEGGEESFSKKESKRKRGSSSAEEGLQLPDRKGVSATAGSPPSSHHSDNRSPSPEMLPARPPDFDLDRDDPVSESDSSDDDDNKNKDAAAAWAGKKDTAGEREQGLENRGRRKEEPSGSDSRGRGKEEPLEGGAKEAPAAKYGRKTTETEVLDARQRYLARKLARERARPVVETE